MSEEKQYLSNGSDADAPTPATRSSSARKRGAKMVDLKFTDLLGTWQHVSLPLSAIDEADFEEGLGFDGSSIRGWKGISESRHAARPRRRHGVPRPVHRASRRCRSSAGSSTRSRREPYERDPRLIATARRGLPRARPAIADTAYFGPEAEFFVFDDVCLRAERQPRLLRGRLAPRATGTRARPGSATRSARSTATSRPPPHDTLHDLRTEMVLTLERARHRLRVPPPRGRDRAASARSTCASRR